MKLLNSNLSPFASRPRLAIYAKQLPVEIEPANLFLPDYTKNPAYLAINPIGLVPTLLLDDGSALPESQVIVEYLADEFSQSQLRPTDAGAAARARLLAQLAETYVQAPARSLVPQLFAPERDDQKIGDAVKAMDQGLKHLDYFMSEDRFAVGETITLADCAIVPYLFFFADRLVETFDKPPIIEKYPKLAAYWGRVQSDPSVERVLAEMKNGLADSRLRMMVEDRAAV